MGLLVTLMVAGLIVGYFSFTAKRVQKKKAGYSRQADKKNPQKAGVDVLKWLFAHGSTLVQLAAYMMLLTAVWLALGDFFPTVWGVANEKVGAKYLIPIMLAVVALVILYITSVKKNATTRSASAAKASGRLFDWQAPFRTAIIFVIAIVAIVAVVNYVSEGGHEGPVRWTDGSLATGWEAAKDGTNPPPVGRGEKLVVTAQIGLLDGLVHSAKRNIDAFFTDTLGIVTHTEPTTLKKSATLVCTTEVCSFCVTSNLPHPENGGNWRFRKRSTDGTTVYTSPYSPTQWHSFPSKEIAGDFSGEVGVMYVYGGPMSGTCVP